MIKRFKVGDKVRIKWDSPSHKGAISEILFVYDLPGFKQAFYQIEIDGMVGAWQDDDLEPLDDSRPKHPRTAIFK